MTTPAKSFDNLRSILGKLDRKIDMARSKRLGLDDEPEITVEPVHQAEPVMTDPADHMDEDEHHGDENGSARQRSPFGRAKPLNRNGGGSSNTWIGGAGVG